MIILTNVLLTWRTNDPNRGTSEPKWFKGVGSNDRFFQCLECMHEDSIEEKK